jgi:hypothetical protein
MREAVLVHAEIRGRIAEANEARQDDEGAWRRFGADHKLNDLLWFRSFRAKLSRIADCYTSAQKGMLGYRAKFSGTQAAGQGATEYRRTLQSFRCRANTGRCDAQGGRNNADIRTGVSEGDSMWLKV